MVVEVSSLESAKSRTSHVGTPRGLPWALLCATEVGRYSILFVSTWLGRIDGGLLGPAELGELVLLTVDWDCPLGEGEGERSVAQCFETEDVGTLRLVVLIGGVYSMRRDERMCMFERT